jgi:hypothetical protein
MWESRKEINEKVKKYRDDDDDDDDDNEDDIHSSIILSFKTLM